MRFRRYTLWIIAVVLSLTTVVYAHPGRTDENGGHYNRSTGEYHYHHGYSEHQHYDMDGDGDVDCPYDFEEPTEATVRRYDFDNSSKQSSKTSKSNSNSSNTVTYIIMAVIFCPILYLYVALPVAALISETLFQLFVNLFLHGKSYNEKTCQVFGYILAVCLTILALYFLIVSS